MLRRILGAGLALLLVTGCAGEPTPSAPSSDPASRGLVASEPSPDPTVAGSLTEASLPGSWLGFEGVVVAPEEGEFNPNGSWVHGQEPELISQQAFPVCSDEVPVLPVPTAALTGTYRNADDEPGNGIALEFATAQDAATWFSGYTAAVAACAEVTDGLFLVQEYRVAGEVLADVRDYGGQTWSERVSLAEQRVILLIGYGTFPLNQLLAPVR